MKKFYIFILIGIICLIFSSPHIYASRHLFPDYWDNYLGHEIDHDRAFYAGMIHEGFEGNFPVSDPGVKEWKDKQSFQPQFSFLISGIIAKIFGSVKNFYLVSGLIFGFLMSWYLFKLIKEISGKWYLSGFAIIYIILLGNMPFNEGIPGWLHLVYNKISGLGIGSILIAFESFRFIRVISPLLVQFILFGALYYLFLVFKGRTSKKHLFLALLFFILSFYSYFYFWTFLLVVVGLMILFNLKRLIRNISARYFTIVGAFFVALVPFINNRLGLFLKYPDYPERLGMMHFRYIDWLILITDLIFIFILFVLTRKKYLSFLVAKFLQILLLSDLVVHHVQLIIGQTLHPRGWLVSISVPLWSICFFVIVDSLLRISKNFKKILYTSGSIVVIVIWLFLVFNPLHLQAIAKGDINHPLKIASRSVIDNPTKDLLNYIKRNIEKEKVILTEDINLNALITSETNANIFLPSGCFTLAPNEEIAERHFAFYKLLGRDEDYIKALFSNEWFVHRLWSDKYRVWQGSDKDRQIVPEFDKERYLDLYRQTSYSEAFKKYAVDYILMSKYALKEPHSFYAFNSIVTGSQYSISEEKEKILDSADIKINLIFENEKYLLYELENL